MDKFYVNPKRNFISSNPSTSRVASSSRTSAEIFQTFSNGRRLGVGNICSKIRHKIEDNLTPKIGGKLYKTGKHSKSLTALSVIGTSTGKYTLTNKTSAETETNAAECKKVKPKSNFSANNRSCINEKQNPYAECYNTSKETSYFEKSSLLSYVDSDEDETQLSLNIAKTSLEDEIFEELEKVAHDESKLNAVLKTFDKIIFQYNDPQIQMKAITNIDDHCIKMKSNNIQDKNSTTINEPEAEKDFCLTVIKTAETFKPKSDKYATAEESNTSNSISCCLKSEQAGEPLHLDLNTNDYNRLEKSSSTLSLTRRKCYQSPNSPCLRQMRHAFTKQQKSKSVWELSNGTKIPILKAIPLKKRSKSFSYNNSEETLINFKLPQTRRLPKISKTLNYNESESLPALPLKNEKQKPDNNVKKLNLTSSTHIKNATKSQNKIISNGKSVQAKSLSSKTKRMTCATNSNLTPTPQRFLSVPLRSKTSDELLDKCLQKGQQILRKVESLNTQQTQITSQSRKSVARTKCNSNNKMNKDILMVKRKNRLHKLNYANEEKIAAPTLESCKIIPPVLGETSDKHAELLVQVINATHLTNNKKSIVAEGRQSAITNNTTFDHDSVIKHQESDSDDSGHISNENMEISINHKSQSSSTSLLEPSSISSSPTSASSVWSNSSSNSVVTKSVKMSDVLKKFERKVSQRPELKFAKNHSSTTTSSSNLLKTTNCSTQQPKSEEIYKQANDSRFFTSYKVAEVESVSVIRTHVEIFPNYTKEVTIRLH